MNSSFPVLLLVFLSSTLVEFQPRNDFEIVTAKPIPIKNIKLIKAIALQEGENEIDPDPVGNASEFGTHQVRLSTMRTQLGWKGTNRELIEILWNDYKSEYITDAILRDCGRRGFRPWKRTLYCYNAGPRSTYGKDPKVMKYIDSVLNHYEELWLKKRKQNAN